MYMGGMICKYSATCLVSTWIRIHSWLVSTPHSVPSYCTPCQPVLIVSTHTSRSNKKYRFDVPYKVLTNLVSNICTYVLVHMYYMTPLFHGVYVIYGSLIIQNCISWNFVPILYYNALYILCALCVLYVLYALYVQCVLCVLYVLYVHMYCIYYMHCMYCMHCMYYMYVIVGCSVGVPI